MIRKLKSGQYRLYSRKIDPKTGKRRNLGTFPTRAKAEHTNARCNTSNAVPEGHWHPTLRDVIDDPARKTSKPRMCRHISRN